MTLLRPSSPAHGASSPGRTGCHPEGPSYERYLVETRRECDVMCNVNWTFYTCVCVCTFLTFNAVLVVQVEVFIRIPPDHRV